MPETDAEPAIAPNLIRYQDRQPPASPTDARSGHGTAPVPHTPDDADRVRTPEPHPPRRTP